MIDIVINEDLIYHTNEYDAILISTNCYQSMRNGFQFDVVTKYPYVLECNYKTKYADERKLGTIIECKNENEPLFILMFNTLLYNYRGNDDDFFNYESLEKCLQLINILYEGKHLATTMIGCTYFDGNANKDKILEIINKNITNLDLTIYDYKQKTHYEIKRCEYITKLKKRHERNKRKLKESTNRREDKNKKRM